MRGETDDFKVEGFDANRGTPIPALLERIRSKEMLYPVINELKLTEKWSRSGARPGVEEVYPRLLKMIHLRQLQKNNPFEQGFTGSNAILIEIGVYSTNPEEAADVANMIAMQYQKWREENAVEGFGGYLGEVRSELDVAQSKVDEARKEVLRIQGLDSIIDPAPEVMDSTGKNLSEEYLSAKKKYLEEKKKLEEVQARYDKAVQNINSLQLSAIYQRASPSFVPARTDVRFILLLAAGIGLFFALPGVALLIMGLCMRDEGGESPGNGPAYQH